MESLRIKSAVIVFLVLLFHFYELYGEKERNGSLIIRESNSTNEKSEISNTRSSKNQDNPPKTIFPEIKPFKIELMLDGFIEDPNSIPLEIEVDHWDDLKVIASPKHGESVKKGEVLLRLDLEKIKLQIQDLNHELAVLELDSEILKNEIELSESLIPLDEIEVERLIRYAKQDLDRFQKIDLPFEKKSSEMKVKKYEYFLSYAVEELMQLKKMYEADDLTEETEEIILKRAQNEVEQAKFSLESAKLKFDEFEKVGAPRKEISAQDSFDREILSLSSIQKIRPSELRKQILEMKKLEMNKKNLLNRRKKLEKDLSEMTLKSPDKGTLYWGTFERGKWSGIEPFKSKLKKGGNLKPYESFLTLSLGKKARARLNLDEKNLNDLSPQTMGVLELESRPKDKINGKIVEINRIPIAPGLYDVAVALSFPKDFTIPKPSTKCVFKIITYQKQDALLLPVEVVFSEDFEKDKKYVYLLSQNDGVIKRIIKVGKKSGDYWEILEGISRKSKILMEKPYFK